jgi:hypothetical protein
LTPPFTPRPIPSISPTTPLSASHTSAQNGTLDGSQHLVIDTPESTPLLPLDSLPTIAGRGNNCFLANDDIQAFLEQDLDLQRLNKIHGQLWMAGRPMRARPLHRYKMLGYEILCTQQMDLHLLRFSSRLIIKPLPEWLLSHDFWTNHLCADETLHKSACGFLLSYVWLVTTPLDLKLAHDHNLLPTSVSWTWWKAFVVDYFRHVDINALDQVNKRYQFGDLRLGRVNLIYRTGFFSTHFIRGYLYGYNRYVIFFERNFSWIFSVFVFFSLGLNAMQVGTGLKDLNERYTFLRASYVGVVLSMVTVIVVLGFVSVLYVGIFLYNMVSAIRQATDVQKERRRIATQRKDEKKEV